MGDRLEHYKFTTVVLLASSPHLNIISKLDMNESQSVFINQEPSNANATDNGTKYELGMKFQSAKAGRITAIRYWKAASEIGTHVGKIWALTGNNPLANVTFSNETASGWQQQQLSTPLIIQSNTIYIVSVNINGFFAITNNGLASSVINGDLSSVADGNNGVLGNPGVLPTNSYQNSNYFCDVVFVADSSTPTVTRVSGDKQSGTVGTNLPNPLVVQVADSSGNLQVGVTVNFAVTSGGGSVSPTSAVTNASGRASTVLTLGTIAGATNTVKATVSGLGSTNFTAKANPHNPNPIYLENQKPGTTNWKITNQATTEIAGYAAATSVNKGGKLEIKVSVEQTGEKFTIDVYRLGYYGGKGGRLIFSKGEIDGVRQLSGKVIDADTRLFQCNWSTSYTLVVATNWISGIYIAKLTHQNGKQSQVWFVVRDDSSTSKILFQSSFTTFQAYNNYGNDDSDQYSLYTFNSSPPENRERAFKVSFDRPFAQTLGGIQVDTLLKWEYNMVRWLESQSYDVSYVTNLDIHTKPQLLQQHKVFLSVGHDEYWSLEQRNAVEQARDGNPPVNLAFFSANTAYWRVRFENSSTGKPNRVMVCYKEAATSSEPTNTFRSKLNNKPESALLGVMYIADKSDDISGGFDFVVKKSDDPYYANTNLNNGDKLSQLVGFEWDAVNANAYPPSGEPIILAESELPMAENPTTGNLEGFPPNTNPRVSHSVRYTAASGAKVFSTGSIQWVWGLDSDGVIPPRADNRARQIAVNILADMGAKPQTPAPNLVVP